MRKQIKSKVKQAGVLLAPFVWGALTLWSAPLLDWSTLH